MLGRYSEDEIWSRFLFQLVIWPKQVTLVSWTQPSGPLCLWQCLLEAHVWLAFHHILGVWVCGKSLTIWFRLYPPQAQLGPTLYYLTPKHNNYTIHLVKALSVPEYTPWNQRVDLGAVRQSKKGLAITLQDDDVDRDLLTIQCRGASRVFGNKWVVQCSWRPSQCFSAPITRRFHNVCDSSLLN